MREIVHLLQYGPKEHEMQERAGAFAFFVPRQTAPAGLPGGKSHGFCNSPESQGFFPFMFAAFTNYAYLHQ
ncbi:MAG: hypothetical protein FJZ79_05880 [Chlorobi bacterium]|nr:hypothetical protein [Chlorobiota bacterium]